MLQVVYASAATETFSPAMLRGLLAKARLRNDLYQVSGMLLYHERSFLQVLEGPEVGVQTILRSIYNDVRHNKVRKLLEVQVAKREFERWSMGFADTGSLGSKAPGQLEFGRSLFNQADTGTRAKQFLSMFQQGIYRQG